MKDDKIIELYWQRDQSAIAATDEKYGKYCFAVADNILGSREDSEECVNDTWLAAWNGMPPHRPNLLRMFLAKLTRSIAFNRYKSGHARRRGGGQIDLVLDELAECLTSESGAEEYALANELGEFIRRFVRELPTREGDIFARRYFFTEPTKSIASRYHISEDNTLVILSRVRGKLREALIKEGFIDEPKPTV